MTCLTNKYRIKETKTYIFVTFQTNWKISTQLTNFQHLDIRILDNTKLHEATLEQNNIQDNYRQFYKSQL